MTFVRIGCVVKVQYRLHDSLWDCIHSGIAQYIICKNSTQMSLLTSIGSIMLALDLALFILLKVLISADVFPFLQEVQYRHSGLWVKEKPTQAALKALDEICKSWANCCVLSL